MAQRVVEQGTDVIYEDARGKQRNLGAGFSPVLTAGGSIALLRGRKHGYGDKFDCRSKETKNWVAIYNPLTNSERVLFDRTIPFDEGKWKFCAFEQMQLSPDGSMLYLVSPVYATAGSLAIIHLDRDTIDYVPGVNNVFVILKGIHRGELIYDRRMYQQFSGELGSYVYPFVHASAEGQPIQVVSQDEYFTTGGEPKAPMLGAYLRHIGGQIIVNGNSFP